MPPKNLKRLQRAINAMHGCDSNTSNPSPFTKFFGEKRRGKAQSRFSIYYATKKLNVATLGNTRTGMKRKPSPSWKSRLWIRRKVL